MYYFLQNVFCSVIVPFLILFAGIFLSVKSDFLTLDIKSQANAARAINGKSKNISPYKALCTSLAGTLGAGNIIGSSIAVKSAGAGSLLWMFLGGLFGMIIKYCEVYLSVICKKEKRGIHYGGPMYYISEFLGRAFACVYSLFGLVSCFGIGNAVQSAAISQNISGILQGNTKRIFLALLLLLCAYFVFFGIKKITKLCAPLVPIMLFLYLSCAIAVIIKNHSFLKEVLMSVPKSAFRFDAGNAFAFFLPLRYGISCSILSNEAGLGSAGIAHACSDTKDAKSAGLFASCEIIFNTMLVGIVTGIAVLCAGKGSGLDTRSAFAGSLGAFGEYTVSLCILLFAFTSIIGWSYYGSLFVSFLTKENTLSKYIYKSVFCIVICVGLFSTISLEKILFFSDLACGAMATINIISILLIYKKGKIRFE